MTAHSNINLDADDYADGPLPADDRDGFDDYGNDVVVPAHIDTDRPQPNRAQRRAADRRPQQPARRPNTARPDGAPEPQDYRPPVQREAESAGVDDEFIDIEFTTLAGTTHTFTVPADPQDWPGSVLHALENRKALTAIEGLLGARAWSVVKHWKMRDINRLYERVAEEGGFAPQGANTKGTAGGKLAALLVTLRHKSNLVEADLSRYHRLDLRDLWRRDEQGRRKLTTRMIYARLSHGLPSSSALAIDENGGNWPWSLTDHLIADLYFETKIGRLGKKAKDHAGRPKTKKQHQEMTPERAAKARSARRRAQQRRENRRRQQGD
ncbi:tail assembly chaperone [Gordonia phage Hibiscus]